MQLSFSTLVLIFHAGSTGELGIQSQCDVLVGQFATCITAKNKCESRVLFLEQLTGDGVDEKLRSFRVVKDFAFIMIFIHTLIHNIFHQL